MASVVLSVIQSKSDRLLIKATADTEQSVEVWIVPAHIRQEIKKLGPSKREMAEMLLNKIGESIVLTEQLRNRNPAVTLDGLTLDVPWPL